MFVCALVGISKKPIASAASVSQFKRRALIAFFALAHTHNTHTTHTHTTLKLSNANTCRERANETEKLALTQ